MKKGMILLSEVIYMLLAALAVTAILFFVISKIYGFVMVQEKDQANGMLEHISNTLASIPENDNDEIFVYTPQDLYFITFANNLGPKNVKVPNVCFMKNCMCICDKGCSKFYCTTIAKPFLDNGTFISEKIPFSATVINYPSNYSIFHAESEGKGKSEVVEKKDSIDIPVIYAYSLISKPRTDLSKVDTIVLHHTGGSTFQDAYDTLVARGLSVHYIVDRDGKIYYLVDEKRLAYHALGINDRSIGIEIVNTGNKNMAYTDAQYTSINMIINSIINRWPNIKKDNQHIIGHYETLAGIARKWDPSPNFDWARIGLPNHLLINLAYVPADAGYGTA